ncbi:(2Fe-2S)-binding protein [Alkaliphilus pronyensis]|uniref:(2Fe-2S)-binding protein n=1 Tax=Alkaliphilus pronyensis TaxID=1482732 RepID=A0A6I0F6E2_9FIRM|nr:(2Fe-2S)-binding protein [Alkaliphilus pronyensis]KAB3531033.1 (2Fe-2S)-binding protein [Alkaliphilus pronyensis]
MKESIIICRCSDLTQQDIRDLINEGYTTFDEIKRISRVGMGPCQGRTCLPLVLKEISIAIGIPMSDLSPGTFRPPVKSIKLEALTEEAIEGGESYLE